MELLLAFLLGLSVSPLYHVSVWWVRAFQRNRQYLKRSRD